MYSDQRNCSAHLSHPAHAKPGITPFPDRLHVVTAISNPVRYAKRYELYRAFAKHMEDSGAVLWTIESAFGDRPFEITSAGHPRHIQVRTRHELWQKENLLNVAIARLPLEAKYIAWVDADLTFLRPDWAQETLQLLQHYDFVQLFSEIVYLSPDYETLSQGLSFMEGWRRGLPSATEKGVVVDPTFFKRKTAPAKHGSTLTSTDSGCCAARPRGLILGAPGGAWAARRTALDAVGGLLDIAILGSGDYHMAAGLMGLLTNKRAGGGELCLKGHYHPEYIAMLLDWQERAVARIQRNVGHMYGVITHQWHGKRQQRGYDKRWKILVKHHFNPRTDLVRDCQGLWQLTNAKPQLRDDLRAYFRSRNEDSIDI